jgi:lipopolysaccharide exporter
MTTSITSPLAPVASSNDTALQETQMRSSASPLSLARGSNRFASDVLTLVFGSASAQVLTIVAAPLVARLFAPEAFGMVAVFSSITGVISSVVGMRYELSIVLPEKDEDASNNMAVSLFFILLISSATAALIGFAGRPLLRVLHADGLRSYLWLVPVIVLLNGIFSALNYWSTRKKKFGQITVAQFSTTAFFVGTQITAGITGHTSGGVIIVLTVLSMAFSTVFLVWVNLRECSHWFLTSVTPVNMLVALKRYSDFPKYSTASALLDNLVFQMPIFLLSSFFSAGVVGQYALGNRLLRIPINLLGTNISTVFFPHAAQAHQQHSLDQSVSTMLRYLISLIVFPSVMLALVGDHIFTVAFGATWAEAGVYTQILSPLLLFWFISLPLGIIFNVLERQALQLWLTAIVLASRIASLVIGGYIGYPRLSLAIFSVSGAVVYGYYCLVALRACNVRVSGIAGVFVRNLIGCAPAVAIILGMEFMRVRPAFIVVTCALMVLVYYVYLVKTDPPIRSVFWGLVHKFGVSRASA